MGTISGAPQRGQKTRSGFTSGFYRDGGLYGITGFIGQPGTGKTYLMGAQVRNCNRVVVFNTVHSFGPGPRQNKLPGFVNVYGLSALADVLRRVRHARFKICYYPTKGKLKREFWHVANMVWEMGDCVFAVDEVWHFGNPLRNPYAKQTDSEDEDSHPFRAMSLTGRHQGITLLYTAQRPALTDYTLRSVTNFFYLGRLTTESERDAFKPILEKPALSKLPTLPARTFVHWNDSGEWKIVCS